MSNYSKLLENTNGSLDLTQMEEQATVSGNGSSASGLSLFRKSSASPDLKEPLTSKDLESGSIYEDDPFYVFREDLYRKLDLVDEALQDYLRVVHHTDTSVNTYELKDVKKQLKRHIKNAESTLRDVQMTVQLVENSRDKFPHIDNTEIYERRSLVTTSKDRISRAKTEMNSDDVKSKMVADERAKAIRRAGGANQTQQEVEHTEFIADSQAQQSLLMQAQDETLDELGEAVTRVGEMAETIHEEIGFQNKMLTQMEEDLSDAEEKLGLVMGKLAKLLKTKSKWHLGTILILSLVVVVLFFLVIYT